MKEPKFLYSAVGSLHFSASSTEEAMDEYILRHGFTRPEQFPEKLTVYRMESKEIDVNLLNPLELVLDTLEELYGDPDSWFQPTEAMKKAEKEFIRVIVREYEVGAFEEINPMVINAREWIENHMKEEEQWTTPND